MTPKQSFISSGALTNGMQTSTPAYAPKKKIDLKGIVQRAEMNGMTPTERAAYQYTGRKPVTQSIPPGGIQKPAVTPASPAATNPAPAAITPPKITSTAGQQYMQGLTRDQQIAGIKTAAAGIQSGINNLKTGGTGTAGTTGTYSEPKTKESEYIKYLRSMFNPNEAKMAQQNINDLNKRTSEEIARTRKEEESLRKNEGGMLEGGQNARLNELSRISNKSLADLAIAKGYATDILKQYTDAGSSLYEAEQKASEEANKPLSFAEAQALGVPIGTTWGQARQKGLIPPGVQAEGFSLSEGQARYDANGNMIASRGKTYAPGTGSAGVGGSYVPGANPTVDSWVNLIKSGKSTITSVPAAYKNAVANALASGSGTYTPSPTSLEATALIDQLLSRDTAPITGAIQQYTGGLFGKNAYTKNIFNQLKGLLSLEKRTLLKGSGAISDYEFRVLENAASSLGRNLDQQDFVTELDKIRTKLMYGEGGGGGTGDMGGQDQAMQLPDGTIVYLQPDGTYE